MTSSSSRPDILVIGVTGTTGSAVARALTARGASYRGLSRRSDATLPAGGEAVVGDIADPDDVARALDGVRALYLVTPSSERAEAQQLRVIERARETGVEHVVLLSQFAAAIESPVRYLRYHAVVEQALSDSGVAGTVLRPNLFMQGLLMFRDLIAAKGLIAAPIGDAKVSVVHADDIGEVGAHALLTRDALGTLTLTGPESLTHREMATTLAEASRRPIQFVDVEPQEFRDSLAGQVPDWQLDGLVEDYAHYRAGEAAQVSEDVARVLGKPARPFAVFAREAANLLTG